MAAKEKIVDDVCVLMVKGKLMGGTETDECHNRVKEIVEQGVKKFVIDLSNVKWVNSRGLGMLMACYTSLKNANGEMKLSGVTKKVNSLLMMTKLNTIFDCYDNSERALGSYKKK